MAYDSSRGRAVLHSGAMREGPAGQTWEYDGEQWVLRSLFWLHVPLHQKMAFDSRRGVTVLHGGWNAWPNPTWSDTWEWDGQSWTWRAASGPHLEGGHAMAFDAARGETVVFGYWDTWVWDGTDWHQRTTSGPSWRMFPAMAYDSRRSVTVLFGGYDIAQPGPCPMGQLADTWEWDGAAWTLRATSGPSARYGHSMAFDSARGVTVLFGGTTSANGVSGETWEWDGREWTLRDSFCYADCDTTTGHHALDIFDFLCFQNRYAAGAPYACDCDTSSGQGVCDVFDFLCFQNAFAAGCP